MMVVITKFTQDGKVGREEWGIYYAFDIHYCNKTITKP